MPIEAWGAEAFCCWGQVTSDMLFIKPMLFSNPTLSSIEFGSWFPWILYVAIPTPLFSRKKKCQPHYAIANLQPHILGTSMVIGQCVENRRISRRLPFFLERPKCSIMLLIHGICKCNWCMTIQRLSLSLSREE